MKRNLSLIYRLSFIIFSVWGLLEYSGVFTLAEKMLEFTFFTDVLSLACILTVFIFTLKSAPKLFLLKIKAVLTFLCLGVIFINSGNILNTFSPGWIVSVLLPVMMFLDWLFFDKKGILSPTDLIIWLLVAAALILAAKYLPALSFLKDIAAFIEKNFQKLLLCLGLGAVLMYLFDALFSGSKSKSKAFNSSLLRGIFLILEIFCFINIAKGNLITFVSGFKYYSLFINFLCFLCVAVSLIYGIFCNTDRVSGILSRIKYVLTIGCGLLPLLFGVYEGYQIYEKNVSFILLIVCPIILVADCLLFDKSGLYKLYDPFLSFIIPLLHFGYTYFLLRIVSRFNVYSYLSVEPFYALGAGFGAALVLGYSIYLVKRLK